MSQFYRDACVRLAREKADLQRTAESMESAWKVALETATAAQNQCASLQRQLEETKVLLAEGATLVRDQAAKIARLNTELADALAERDAWKGIHDGQQRVYNDIGANLGADMPRELVNEVARRRMAELAALKEECDSWRHAALTRDTKGDQG